MTRTAIITGSSGGIGSSIAKNLGMDHNIVAHYYNNEEGAKTVVENVKEQGQSAIAYQCDIRDPGDVNSMVNKALDTFDDIDVLVNNGAVFHETKLQSASNEIIQETLQINLEGALYCSREVLQHMIEQEKGWIINISSIAGTDGSRIDPTYSASKSGLIGLTKSLSKQHTDKGIFANAVAPGPVKTKMFPEALRPSARERSAIDRLIEPEEVARLVRLFATTFSITGQTLVIDGGIRL